MPYVGPAEEALRCGWIGRGSVNDPGPRSLVAVLVVFSVTAPR